MKTNPLDQLSGICEQLLFRVANLHKSFKQFFIETMFCYFLITGRVNFSQMARFSQSCESRFRQNFKKKFDWVAFNTGLADKTEGHSRFQIEFIYRDAKQFTGLNDCQARNANSLDFAFNASLSAVNIAKALSAESGLNLSVEDVKILIHNTVMAQRILSTFGKDSGKTLQGDLPLTRKQKFFE